MASSEAYSGGGGNDNSSDLISRISALPPSSDVDANDEYLGGASLEVLSLLLLMPLCVDLRLKLRIEIPMLESFDGLYQFTSC